jgi:hypothetical protein
MTSKTHAVLPGSKRGKDPAATRVGNVDPQQKIVITIGLAGPNLPDADEYVGQTLTSATFADKFGAWQADADKVAKSLKKYGLVVEKESRETRSMTVSGTAKRDGSRVQTGIDAYALGSARRVSRPARNNHDSHGT